MCRGIHELLCAEEYMTVFLDVVWLEDRGSDGAHDSLACVINHMRIQGEGVTEGN